MEEEEEKEEGDSWVASLTDYVTGMPYVIWNAFSKLFSLDSFFVLFCFRFVFLLFFAFLSVTIFCENDAIPSA